MKETELCREQWIKDKSMQREWVQFIEKSFKDRPCVFGSLVYPQKPHITDVRKSVNIYTEQVLRRSCKSHPGALRRVFVAEQTPGEAIRSTRIQPIPMNGQIRNLLIKRSRITENPSPEGMPDIPHIHFMMEVPNEFDPAAFAALCEQRWLRMNVQDMNCNSRLAKVEVVGNVSRVARYITKEYIASQGENIILTHATCLG